MTKTGLVMRDFVIKRRISCSEQEQEQPMEEGDDDPHLDLERARETQAYNLIKNHEFIHMVAYDPDLLEKIGMDTKFTTI